MLKQQARLFNRLNILFDFGAILVAFVLAHYMRRQFPGNVRGIQGYLWSLTFIVPVWFFLLTKHNLYASIRRLSVFDIVSRLVNVHLMGGLVVASIIYFIDKDGYSRGLYAAFVGISLLLLTIEKVTLRIGLGFLRRRGLNTRDLLIVGTDEKALRFHELVEDHTDWGLKVAGFVQVSPQPFQVDIEGHNVLGHVKDIVAICKEQPVDEVIFCLPKQLFQNGEDYLKDLEELGITVRMVLDFFDSPLSKRELSFFHGELPILTFHTKCLDAQQLFLKRILDVFGALLGLGIGAMLLPFIALAIKIDSPGPIFFGQKRIGESGRPFKCWKFRSMYVDAEERKREVLAQNEMNGAIFKIKDDPRITKVGKFLRKASLDELPQFWNVLKADMSLVGTRPPTPDEVAQYENWHRRRISIKPGITGMWQTSGRNKITDFDDVVRLDLHYIDKWSIWLDLLILLKTIKAILARTGSY